MLSKFSVKKPYSVVVGVVLIMILGFVTFTNMTVDLLPNMNLPYAIVMTTYPGASPEEVEMTVTKPVEQGMATISNISDIQSTSSENTSMVVLEFAQTANMDSVTIEMRETLDQIRSYWPDTVGNPIIMKLNPTMMPILVVGVSTDGENPAQTSKRIEEQVVPEIESIEGVASVTSVGSIEETVEVTVNKEKVDQLNSQVREEMERQFAEASAALEEARAKVESGKAQLEAGQAQAASQIGQAESQISVKAEELRQAQLEISEKQAQLSLGETSLNQNLIVVRTTKAAVQAGLQELEALKGNETSIRSEYERLREKEETEGLTSEEQAQLVMLSGQVEQLDHYEESKQELESRIADLEAQEQGIQEQLEQLKEAQEQLETMGEQVAAGSLSLAEARGQLASAQMLAAIEISQGSTQLAVGEAALVQQETQLEAAQEEAGAEADLEGVLTAEMVQNLLAAQNFSMPAGYVEEDGIEYLVRVGEKFQSLDEMRSLVLLDVEGMDPIRLSDVAEVELVNNADETYARLNGAPGVILSVQKQTGYSTGDVSDRVLKRFRELEEDEELGIDTITLMDQGLYIDMIVNSVLQNLMFGAVLAIIILLVFLRSVRSTFVIACSIPISILAALVAMYFSGLTLNIISLSGLALGVGMLVDNSIVVIENIYRMRNEEGASAKEAAIEGAKQVSGAIAASTLTTICVFAPIVFTEGVTRQLFVDMGLTIAYSLLASLLVALTVVPMMAAGLLKKTEARESRLLLRVREGYGRLLEKSLRRKAVVLLGSLAFLIVSGVLAFSRGTEFMPSMESTELSMTLEMEKGSSLEETSEMADEIIERVGSLEDVEDIGAMIGGAGLMGSGTDETTVQFYAITKEDSRLSNAELEKKIEDLTKDLDGELTVNMSSIDMGSIGTSGIAVQIRGKELDTLQKISADVKEIVAGVDGTQNVLDGTEENKEELRVIVDKAKAMSYGLTVAQVYQAISGEISEAQSITALSTDSEDYDIYVVDGATESMDREDIRNLMIETSGADGSVTEVKLSELASFEEASGLQAISRSNQNRIMTVTAEIQEGDNIGLVSRKITAALEKYEVPEGYEIEMQGEDETINEAMTELTKMLALALIFMYLIMVAQFQSLLSPFIIMFTVPLAFTGGLFGLWIGGMTVSVISMVGFVMLSGIIVNNGIVYIDYANQLIREGEEQRKALILAGQTRLRPIVMTALTTILGLSTMAAGFGMGSDMVQPMAVVTIGGLIYGTVLTLFVVPCIFDLVHRKKKSVDADENFGDNENVEVQEVRSDMDADEKAEV